MAKTINIGLIGVRTAGVVEELIAVVKLQTPVTHPFIIESYLKNAESFFRLVVVDRAKPDRQCFQSHTFQPTYFPLILPCAVNK